MFNVKLVYAFAHFGMNRSVSTAHISKTWTEYKMNKISQRETIIVIMHNEECLPTWLILFVSIVERDWTVCLHQIHLAHVYTFNSKNPSRINERDGYGHFVYFAFTWQFYCRWQTKIKRNRKYIDTIICQVRKIVWMLAYDFFCVYMYMTFVQLFALCSMHSMAMVL